MLYRRSDKSRRLIKESLRSGKVAVLACDTIYGFVGRAPDTEGLIRSIKGRGEHTPFLQLISDMEVLSDVSAILPRTDILSMWPGPFTFILQLKNGGTAGFRIPEDPSLRFLLKEVGFPLFSTSVNRSGRPAMNNPAEIEVEFGNEIEVIEDSGLFHGRLPSTVVDLTITPYRILRQGAGIVPGELL